MNPEVQQLNAGIHAFEAQRAALGDAVVDTAVASLRARLAALEGGSEATPEPVLRQVTVLFLDVVGSTTLSRRLDPEEVSAVMDGTLDRCTAIVRECRGKVLQYAGDSLLAAFGADEAREDDVERAVRAGLLLRDAGRELAADVLARHRHEGFNLRIGIHTGEVLLGGGVDEEGTIRGAAVNIAARMEQTAPPGQLRISHDTYRHVRGVFDVEPQPPIKVKGYDEPIVSYLVQRAKPRAFRVASRGIEGVETRMVGRDAEMEQLRTAFLCLVQPGATLVRIGIVADAGSGKSRLLYEFQNWAEARAEAFFLFQGRATPSMQTQPYGLLRDILAWRLRILDSDSMAAAKAKLEDGIAPLFVDEVGGDDAQAHAHILGQLIGLDFTDSRHVAGIKDDARQIRSRGFHVAAQMFRCISSQGAAPIVLLLDDLHWADDASLSFLEYMAAANGDVPMLMLALTRATLFEREGGATRAWFDTAARIDLLPLSRDASRALADELLKKMPEVPVVLRELVTGRSDGNPFYMEELVKMLVDAGAIRIAAEQWTLVPEKLLSIKVPHTLTGIVQARLDGLPGAERLALQLASVIGITFWDQALAFIDSAAPRELAPLTRRELIAALGDAAVTGESGDAREYAFSHQILHHVTYETVLKSRRRTTHARVAQWFAQATGARANDFLGTAAEHFEQAGDAVTACDYFARAAEHAALTFSHESTMAYTERALRLAGPQDAAMRWRLLANRERSLDLQGRRDEQLRDVETLLQLAEMLDDDEARAEAAYRRCDIALRTGDYPTTEREARRSMALARRAGADEVAMRAQVRLSSSLANQGNTAEAKVLARQGLARAKALGQPRLEMFFANCVGICADLEGDTVTALTHSRRCLELGRQIGDRRAEAVAIANVGLWYLQFGAHATARAHLGEGLRLNRTLGIRETVGHVLCSLSELALAEGEKELALAHAQEALDISLQVGSRQNQTSALAVLGNAELALGRSVAAAATFERMHALAREIDFAAAVVEALEGVARVALTRDEVSDAARAVDQLLAQAGIDAGQEGDAIHRFAGGVEHRVRLTIHQVWERTGDARAPAALAEAHRSLHVRAAAISDAALRESYLTRVAAQREIEALWAAHRDDR